MLVRLLRFAVATTLFAGGSLLAHPQDQRQTPADNTKVNKRDRSQDQVTADQQKMNPADRETSRKIRNSLMKDKSLSTYAHNVKIIARNGDVILKGPVHSEEEKAAIEEKAAAVVGKEHVTNQLEVTPEKQ